MLLAALCVSLGLVSPVEAAPTSLALTGDAPGFTPPPALTKAVFVPAVPRPEGLAVAPVEVGRVGSGFGYRRARLRRRRVFHAGIDFQAARGTPVLAAQRGVVTHVASESDRLHGFLGYGNAVVLYHPETDAFSLYAHLDAVLVQPGQGLAAGEKLGRVGNTHNGRFRGMAAHLHFEVRQRTSDGLPPFPGPYRDNAIDPLEWLLDQGMPVGERRTVGLPALAMGSEDYESDDPSAIEAEWRELDGYDSFDGHFHGE